MSHLTIKLNAVGDVWLGDHPVRIGHGVASVYRQRGAQFLFGPSAAVLAEGDVNFCNLESVLSHAGRRRGWLPSIEMRGPPQGAQALRQAGFNVVSVANNHMMQHGAAAFADTIERVQHAGLATAGVDGLDGRTQPVDLQIAGQQLRIVAFSMRPEQYYQGRPAYSHREEPSQILKEVASLRAGCDHLIVSLHWGDEYMSRPHPAQVRLARALIEQGVRVILGHHPHVLQGWEYHREGLILYSLGNFVFDLWPHETRKSAVAHLELQPGVRPSLRFTPIWLTQDYQPVVAVGERAEEIHQDLQRLAQQLAASIDEDPAAYQAEARRAQSRMQKSSYQYFAKNLYRYSPNMLVQSVGRTVLRRLSGR